MYIYIYIYIYICVYKLLHGFEPLTSCMPSTACSTAPAVTNLRGISCEFKSD